MSIPVALAGEVEEVVSCSRNPEFEEKELPNILINGRTKAAQTSVDPAGPNNEEFMLHNGDSFFGTLMGNVPDGTGKYIWSDGCAYEGEWKRGMRHGSGKISWPSGAVYEGEFSGGYMHGTGSYIGYDGISYKGRWKLSRKHGLGCQTYPNGDIFEGSWIQGVIVGPGKYVWANGNVYFGNMRCGKMSGNGTLSWKNGDSYEGNWLDGMMDGFGIYTWNERGCYVGTWTRGLKDGKGVFYPQGSKIPVAEELYLSALRKKGVLPDLKRQNLGSRILHFASMDMGNTKVGESQGSSSGSSHSMSKGNLLNIDKVVNTKVTLERRWSMEVAIEKVIGQDVSSETIPKNDENVLEQNFPILEREYVQGVLISELVLNSNFSLTSKRARRRQKKLAKESKGPGETIIKGHRSYDLMLSLQLGIRQILFIVFLSTIAFYLYNIIQTFAFSLPCFIAFTVTFPFPRLMLYSCLFVVHHYLLTCLLLVLERNWDVFTLDTLKAVQKKWEQLIQDVKRNTLGAGPKDVGVLNLFIFLIPSLPKLFKSPNAVRNKV